MKKMNVQNDLDSRNEIAHLSLSGNKSIMESKSLPKDAESEIVQEYAVDENNQRPETKKGKTGRKTQGDV